MDQVRRLPRPLVIFIGVTEVFGALGLVLPMAAGILPWLRPLAAVGLTIARWDSIATVAAVPPLYLTATLAVLSVLAVAIVIIAFQGNRPALNGAPHAV